MVDVRKIIIIFVIGILFSVLVFSVIEAVYPEPEYEDFCKDRRYMEYEPVKIAPTDCGELYVPAEEKKECLDKDGYIDYELNSVGCPISYSCNTCQKEYDDAREGFYKVVFYVSALLALVAIFIAMYLPAGKNQLNEWIGTGFMLGGTFALFFGTMQSFSYLDRIVRPIVIFLELVLVIYVTYKKIGNLKEDKKK